MLTLSLIRWMYPRPKAAVLSQGIRSNMTSADTLIIVDVPGGIEAFSYTNIILTHKGIYVKGVPSSLLPGSHSSVPIFE